MSKICPLDGRKTNCTDNCDACLREEAEDAEIISKAIQRLEELK